MVQMTYAKEQYADYLPAGNNNYYAHLKLKEEEIVNEDKTTQVMITCVESIVKGHVPTQEDYDDIEARWLIQRKKEVDYQISAYDVSPEVNGFYLNGEHCWLDKNTRVGLINSIEMEIKSGKEQTTLWLNNSSYTLGCEEAMEFMCSLEIYAKECYNRTAEHKYAVSELTTIAEVDEYDYTTGYPTKLSITIPTE